MQNPPTRTPNVDLKDPSFAHAVQTCRTHQGTHVSWIVHFPGGPKSKPKDVTWRPNEPKEPLVFECQHFLRSLHRKGLIPHGRLEVQRRGKRDVLIFVINHGSPVTVAEVKAAMRSPGGFGFYAGLGLSFAAGTAVGAAAAARHFSHTAEPSTLPPPTLEAKSPQIGSGPMTAQKPTMGVTSSESERTLSSSSNSSAASN